MLALGTMCEDAATDLLQNGIAAMSLTEDDKKVAQAALDERRSDRVKAWCSNPSGQGSKHISL